MAVKHKLKIVILVVVNSLVVVVVGFFANVLCFTVVFYRFCQYTCGLFSGYTVMVNSVVLGHLLRLAGGLLQIRGFVYFTGSDTHLVAQVTVLDH